MNNIITRVCSKCKKEKPISEYHKSTRSRTGHKYECKECFKKYYAESPEMARKRDLERKFGLTVKDYETLLVAQDGVCKICKTTPDSVALHVDHDHATMKVRGLLCRKCNLALGLVKDSPEILKTMIDYLR